MTVGFLSPLPPARTGVADYSASLLRALSRRGAVQLSPRYSGVNLYHIGNNQMHAEIYRRAISEPGVVVLHDAVLQHFALGFFSREEYIDEFVYNYGAWNRGIAEELWNNRSRAGVDERYFRYGMLRRLAETSRAVIVHNPAAARAVLAHAPRARVVEIPHLFEPPPSSDRAALPVPPEITVLGIFGHLRESKRLYAVLRVLEKLRDRAVLLLAGDCASRDLSRAFETLRSKVRVLRFPFTPDREFWQLAHATGICINLRYPAAGETSGIATRFMGIGKPVIATAGGELDTVPPGACVPIDGGVAEEEMLLAALEWLIAYPGDAKAIGANAARYISEHHGIERVADLYWRTLMESA